MTKRWIAVFITIILFTLSAQATWEGSTAVSLHGELPEKGLYAASNAFPRNTVIEVSNPSTGQTAKVTVTERLTAPGLFLLISKTTADNLGMDYEDIIPAKAVIIDRKADTVSLYEEDLILGSSGKNSDSAKGESVHEKDSSFDSILSDLYPAEKSESVLPVENNTDIISEKEKTPSFLMPELIPETESGEVASKKEIEPLIRVEETKKPEIKEEIVSKGTLSYKGKNREKTPENLLPSAQDIIVPDMSLVFDESEPVEIASWEETDNIINIPLENGDKDFSKATVPVEDSLFFPDTMVTEPGRIEMKTEDREPEIVAADTFTETEEKEILKIAEIEEAPVKEETVVPPVNDIEETVIPPVENIEESRIASVIPEKIEPSPALAPLEPVRLFDPVMVSHDKVKSEKTPETVAKNEPVVKSEIAEKTMPPESSMSLFDGLEGILDDLPESEKSETLYREDPEPEEEFFISRDVIVEPDILETPDDEEYSNEYADIELIDNPSVSENLVPEALMLSPDDYEEFEALEFDDSEIVVEEEPVLTLLEAEEKFPSSDGDEEAFAILPLEIEEPETNVTDEFSEEPEIAFLLEPSSMKPPESSSDVVPETSSEEEKTDKSDLLPDFLDVSDVSEKVEVAEKFPKTASLKGLNETSHEKLENAVVVSLEKGEYLQIGAFSQSKPLLNNYERISNTYPLSLVPVEKNEKVLYKLLVGPLNEDEKGLILIQFKDMGYKDAFFIRR